MRTSRLAISMLAVRSVRTAHPTGGGDAGCG